MMDTGTLLGVKYHGGTDFNLKKYVEIQLESFAERENGDFDILEDGEYADLDLDQGAFPLSGVLILLLAFW